MSYIVIKLLFWGRSFGWGGQNHLPCHSKGGLIIRARGTIVGKRSTVPYSLVQLQRKEPASPAELQELGENGSEAAGQPVGWLTSLSPKLPWPDMWNHGV